MDSSHSSVSTPPKTKERYKYARMLFKPWMLACGTVFLFALLFGIASLFSPEWATKSPGEDFVGLLRSCSVSFGCFDTSSIWCLPDRSDNCRMMKLQLQLVLFFCMLACFLSGAGVIFSFPLFTRCILVMGIGISILSALSYVAAAILFITINKHFFVFSTLQEPAQFTYGFYFCVVAAACSLCASLFALKAAHSQLVESNRQEKKFAS